MPPMGASKIFRNEVIIPRAMATAEKTRCLVLIFLLSAEEAGENQKRQHQNDQERP